MKATPPATQLTMMEPNEEQEAQTQIVISFPGGRGSTECSSQMQNLDPAQILIAADLLKRTADFYINNQVLRAINPAPNPMSQVGKRIVLPRN